MSIKAVIFDMDGVLIDSEPYYAEDMYRFLSFFGVSIAREEMNRMAGAQWIKTEEWMAELMGVSLEEMRKRYAHHSSKFNADYRAWLNPGVKEVLAYLKGKGIKLAIASSTMLPEIEKMVKVNDLGHYFDALVSGHELPESKPSPMIYFNTMEMLGVTAEETLAVEDSTLGITAAKRAEMRVIAKRDERFGFDQREADFMVDELTQIMEIC